MERYLSVDIGGTKTEVARLSIKGFPENPEVMVEESRIIKTKNYSEAERFFTDIIEIMRELGAPDLKGIGISSGGLIEGGVILDWTDYRFLENYPIKERVEREMSLPVSVRNDVECMVMGEWALGAGKGKKYKNFLGVVLGTGIGACLLLDGEPFKGSHNYGGEVGEFEVDGKSLESYANGAALRELSGTDGERLHELAKAGDEKALEAFKGYGKRAASVIRNVFAAYDPDMIVLAGSIAKSFGYFSGPMYESLKGTFVEAVYKHINVVPSRLENPSLMGAVVPLIK